MVWLQIALAYSGGASSGVLFRLLLDVRVDICGCITSVIKALRLFSQTQIYK